MSVTRVPTVHLFARLGATAALVTTTLAAVATTTQSASATAPGASADRPITLHRDPGSATSAASVSLAAPSSSRLAGGAAAPVLTGRLDTAPYKMVAVTWTSGRPSVEVRYRGSAGWSGWTDLEPLADGPNPAEAARATRRGTELLWVGRADGVQVRSTAATGLRLELVDPGTLASDRTARAVTTSGTTSRASRTSTTTAARATTRPKVAPRPSLLYRSAWNPNPDWLNGTPRYETKVKQVHVHHTATANGYSRDAVPGILRGMYRYHTQTLGWFDIGYNFLVDRFGRTWVGRSGGPNKRVRGAHTLGFNQNSTGVAVIGNFQSTTPPKVVIDALIRMAAWKLDLEGLHATGTVTMYSQGSDRFPKGRAVRLPRIDGHRDTNETACPGLRLYQQLPVIRKRTEYRINLYS